MKLNQTSVLCLASFVLSLSAHAAFTRLATETYPGGGGGPTGGVSKAYVDAHDLATLFASTNYTDAATNALDLAHLAALAATNTALRSVIAASAASSTNYTDAATNTLAASYASQLSYASQSATNYTDTSTLAATNFVKAGYLPLDGQASMTGPLRFSVDEKIYKYGNHIRIEASATEFYYPFEGYLSVLYPDNTPVATLGNIRIAYPIITNAYTKAECDALFQTNLVVSASTADKVLKNDGTTLYWGEGGGGGGGSPLAGAQYNFHNGTNFTWTIYATLTNALVKMGATVTNPPALDESTLVHPIVVTASTSTGTPLSGKTYDFHGGTNFVKSVYEALEQAVRDLGATTINTPTF